MLKELLVMFFFTWFTFSLLFYAFNYWIPFGQKWPDNVLPFKWVDLGVGFLAACFVTIIQKVSGQPLSLAFQKYEYILNMPHRAVFRKAIETLERMGMKIMLRDEPRGKIVANEVRKFGWNRGVKKHVITVSLVQGAENQTRVIFASRPFYYLGIFDFGRTAENFLEFRNQMKGSEF